MDHFETVWEFNTARFSVVFAIAPEDMDPADSFQFDEDIAAVRDGLVEWFQAKVAVYFDGKEIAADYLGGCAYKSAREFAELHRKYKGGDYFTDMVRVACNEARKVMRDMRAIRIRGEV